MVKGGIYMLNEILSPLCSKGGGAWAGSPPWDILVSVNVIECFLS